MQRYNGKSRNRCRHPLPHIVVNATEAPLEE
jgi:hypothetical protein